eukprot:COSAG06_NODE_64877_length_258_cov_0.861635_1_plen_57_part_01
MWELFYRGSAWKVSMARRQRSLYVATRDKQESVSSGLPCLVLSCLVLSYQLGLFMPR